VNDLPVESRALGVTVTPPLATILYCVRLKPEWFAKLAMLIELSTVLFENPAVRVQVLRILVAAYPNIAVPKWETVTPDFIERMNEAEFRAALVEDLSLTLPDKPVVTSVRVPFHPWFVPPPCFVPEAAFQLSDTCITSPAFTAGSGLITFGLLVPRNSA